MPSPFYLKNNILLHQYHSQHQNCLANYSPSVHTNFTLLGCFVMKYVTCQPFISIKLIQMIKVWLFCVLWGAPSLLLQRDVLLLWRWMQSEESMQFYFGNKWFSNVWFIFHTRAAPLGTKLKRNSSASPQKEKVRKINITLGRTIKWLLYMYSTAICWIGIEQLKSIGVQF